MNPPSNACTRCGGIGVDPEPSGMCYCGDYVAGHDDWGSGHSAVEMEAPCQLCKGKGILNIQ